MSLDIKLPRWSPKGIERDGRFFLFLGRHGVGKTSCLSRVLSYLGDYCEDWIGFSPTMGGVETLTELMPACYVYDRAPTEEDLEHLIARQKKERKLAKKFEDYEPRKLGIVLDDVGFAKKFLRSSEKLAEIVMNQRHYGMFLFITIQYIRQLNPELHTQVDYLFQLNTSDPKSNALSYEAFFQGKMGTKEGVNFKRRDMTHFNKLIDLYATKPGQALVVQRSRKPYLSFFEWPKEFEKPRIGDEEFWESAGELMGSEEELSEDEDEILRDLERATRTRFLEH